ncbi:MAG: type II toxin-antitoxin system RelE/ParE family toxin [Acetobacteraceae bacterium]
MTGYLLSPAAQADLGEIWDYSAQNWGAEQAERYVLAIRNACEALAAGRKRGRPIDEIRPGYRKLAVQLHFLFYRVTDTGLIDVVRILHRQMDLAARLKD